MSTPASVTEQSNFLRLRSLLIYVFVLISHCCYSNSQPSYFFLGAKEFEGVQIYDVIQDNNLNYWISTDNGIYKYDNYTFAKKEIQGSSSAEVFGFVKNNQGTIYCYNLINQIIQIKDDVCSLFYEFTAEQRSTDIYLSISPQNDLLVFSKTLLVFEHDGTQVAMQKPVPKYYGFPFLTPSQKILSHAGDSDSLLVYENRSFRYVKMDMGGHEVSGVLKFFMLDDLIFAMGTANKEIYLFDEKDYSLALMPSTALDQTKEPFRIYNVNNQAWAAGVTSGVRVLTSYNGLTCSDIFYPQYLISNVFQDAEGNLLLSTFNHGILVVPDMNVPDVLHIPNGNSIVSIQTDSRRGMLMGTLTGKLLAFNNGTYTTLSDSGARPLQSIFSWPEFPFIIYDDGSVKAMNKETGAVTRLALGSLKDAALADDSTIYIAMNIGLKRVRWKGGNAFESTMISSLHKRCFAIAFSEANNRLFASTSDGVHVLHPDGKVVELTYNGAKVYANDISCSDGVTYLATKEGIYTCSGDVVEKTIPLLIQGKAIEASRISVSHGIISAITSEGFAQFDLEGNVVMQLNTQQGFSTNRLYDFDITADEIWVCHSQGVQQLNTATLHVPTAKPLLSFSAFMINDTVSGSFDVPGVYSSDERKFRFILSSPTLRNKENIVYHYQLSGYDDAWFTAPYSENEIVYNALAPGDYVLTVKAENNGVFSESIVYSFTISAPFYSRWWFTAGICIALLIIVTLVYRYRLQLQEKKAKLENELAASRLTAIQSQMNPHFIFNSLNSIQDLVLKGDVDNSYTFITKFSNLVRRTLNYSDKDFVEFNQEIKLLELYLALEKLRFKDDLEFRLSTNGIDDILIPPMLIQPFIENSLLHGLLHKEGKKKLSITFTLNEHLVCVVEDNGIGREKAREIKNRQRSEHESFAGQAIKNRFSILSRIFKSELGYVYEDMYEGNEAIGTRVKLTIPVKRSF